MATNSKRIANGNSIDVTISSAVAEGDLAFIEGWLGFVPRASSSGESVALNIEYAEFDMILPTGLSLSKGDEVWVDTTDLTGHIPDDTAYGSSNGGSDTKLGRCVIDQDGTTGRVRIQSALRGQ